MKRKAYYEIAAAHSIGLRMIVVLPPVKAMPASESMRARAIPGAGIIMIRRPDTLERLRRFLHECAHCKLHLSPPPGTPYHWLELEAENYAFNALAGAGIEIPKKLRTDSQWHIMDELMADLRSGADPAPGVFEYLEFDQSSAAKLLDRFRKLPRTDKFLRGMGYVSLSQVSPKLCPAPREAQPYSSVPFSSQPT